jgi:hypothetical protein
MAKQTKNFDCIRMKREIQQSLLEESRERGESETRKLRMEKVRNNPILGPFLRKIERDGKSGQPKKEPHLETEKA